MEKPNVFVYGTLRTGQLRNRALLETGSVLIFPKAAIRGFELYNLGAFPGIVPGPGRVLGEMYQIDPSTLTLLDRIEGTDSSNPQKGLYRRELVQVFGEHSADVAWVYIYNYTPINRSYSRIESGDWLNRI